jgi:hypothetical protein
MEKSIESIWKEGFMAQDALVAPKLNDLYNQKSTTIIDKFTRMMQMNLVGIVAGAAVVFVASLFLHVPYLGAFLTLLLAVLVIVGKKKLALLEQIDKGVSSYQYLKAFDTWLKETIAVYARIYRFFYPAICLTIAAATWFAKVGDHSVMQTVLRQFPDLYQVQGIPVYGAMVVALLSCLSGIFAGAIYRFDLKTIYGHEMKKLEEIIADMEELRR